MSDPDFRAFIADMLDDLAQMSDALSEGSDPALVLVGDTLRRWVIHYGERLQSL